MNNKILETYDNIPSTGMIVGHGKPSLLKTIYDNPNGRIPSSNSKFHAYRQQIVSDADRLKEKCAKHILLDIYMKVLPFDDGYCDGNKGIVKKDIDNFISNKNTTGLQYLQSSYESTKAPLLEFVIRSINSIGSEYTETAIEKVKNDLENDLDVPPTPVQLDDDNIDNQLIDVKKDIEYEDFIEKLKKKTVNKIVSDISELLKDKKDEKDMSFSVQTESSSFKVALDYITEWSIKNAQEIGTQDDNIGLAIRESTLNEFDVIFRQKGSSINEYTTKIRFGKGIVINESALGEYFQQFYLGDADKSSPIDEYDALITEHFTYLDAELTLLTEATIGDNISKGINAVGKGIKWLINKIIEIAKKMRNAIRNIFKPKAEKQLKNMKARDAAVESALSSVGINSNHKLSSGSSGATHYQTITTADLGSKAEKGFKIKDSGYKDATLMDDNKNRFKIGTIIKINDGNAIIELSSKLINLKEYKLTIDRYIIPLIKSKFSNIGLIQTAKLKLGAEGNLLPILNGPYADTQIDTNEFFPECNELLEYIIEVMNLPEVKEMENDPNVDPYFSKLLNGMMLALNMINIRMREIDLCITYQYKNPYNRFELDAIKDRDALGKIVGYIMLQSDIKNTMQAYSIIKPFITTVCKVKKWIHNSSDTPSGASRITVITTDKDKFIYKYAWNRKGIFDNKLDLRIKNVVMKDVDISDRFALPTDDSPNDGIYVIVPKASIKKNVDPHDIMVFNDKLERDIDNRNMKIIPGDLHKDNIGFLNGKMVIVDYGNFQVY